MNDLVKLFENKLDDLKVSKEAKAYITNVFTKVNNVNDLSKKSLTLEYYDAKCTYSFQKFQTLADWILFAEVFFPKCLSNATEDYYCALGQNSYYFCYRIVNKQWKLYEELADQLPELIKDSRVLILSNL